MTIKRETIEKVTSVKNVGIFFNVLFYGVIVYVLYKLLSYINKMLGGNFGFGPGGFFSHDEGLNGNPLDQGLGAAAEAHGQAASAAALGPQLNYATARSAWYKAWDLLPMGSPQMVAALSDPNFPTVDDWTANHAVFDNYEPIAPDNPDPSYEVTTAP